MQLPAWRAVDGLAATVLHFGLSAAGCRDATYTGRRRDRESGLSYYRARCFSAQLGRFASRDPIGYEGGINLYEYVKDSPAMRTDATGHQGGDYCTFPYATYCPQIIIRRACRLQIAILGTLRVSKFATGRCRRATIAAKTPQLVLSTPVSMNTATFNTERLTPMELRRRGLEDGELAGAAQVHYLCQSSTLNQHRVPASRQETRRSSMARGLASLVQRQRTTRSRTASARCQ